MAVASGQVVVLAPAARLLREAPDAGDAGWLLVGRGWCDPVTRLIQSDPALASRITVVTDPEDPDLDHGKRLGIRVQVRPEVVSQIAQQVRALSGGAPAASGDSGYAAAAPQDPVSMARVLAIETTRRLLLVRGLSRREAEVAASAVEGDDNARIAAELFLSRNTVKRHLGSAYRKLGVRHRTGLRALVHAAVHAAVP